MSRRTREDIEADAVIDGLAEVESCQLCNEKCFSYAFRQHSRTCGKLLACCSMCVRRAWTDHWSDVVSREEMSAVLRFMMHEGAFDSRQWAWGDMDCKAYAPMPSDMNRWISNYRSQAHRWR